MPPTSHRCAYLATIFIIGLLASCSSEGTSPPATTTPAEATTIARTGTPQEVDPTGEPRAELDQRARWAEQTAINIARSANASPTQQECLEENLARLSPAEIDQTVSEAITGTTAPGPNALADIRARCGLPDG